MQNLFVRSPWEREAVVVLRHAGLGQNKPTCEITPEGGQYCADGTYLPPSNQGRPLVNDFPVVPVALAIAGVAAAGAILFS